MDFEQNAGDSLNYLGDLGKTSAGNTYSAGEHQGGYSALNNSAQEGNVREQEENPEKKKDQSVIPMNTSTNTSAVGDADIGWLAWFCCGNWGDNNECYDSGDFGGFGGCCDSGGCGCCDDCDGCCDSGDVGGCGGCGDSGECGCCDGCGDCSL